MKKVYFIIIVLLLNAINIRAQIVAAQEGSNEKWGFVDEKGKWIVEPIYSYARWSNRGYGEVYDKSVSEDACGMVDEAGKMVYPIGEYTGFYLHEGDAKEYVTLTNIRGEDGLGTISGKVIIPCKYKSFWFNDSSLSDDALNYWEKRLTAVTVTGNSGKQGVYSLTGKQLVPILYDHAIALSFFIQTYMEENRSYDIYSYEGKLLLKKVRTYLNNNQYVGFITSDDRVHLFRIGENSLVNLDVSEFDKIEYDNEDVLTIQSNGKWGLFGDDRVLIPCEFDEPIRFVNDVATVKKDGEVKLIKNPLKDGSQIMIAEGGSGVSNKKKVGGPAVSRYPAPDSDVDRDIPVAKGKAENTFAFIIANENYPDAPVPYSLNDGRMFKEYCQKTLGLPEKNINLYEDATFGNIITAVEKMKQVADAYDGDASVIFYYAGHGFPDDKQQTAYLLPIDGDASSITTTGYSLAKLYKEIAGLKMKSAVVFLDACFSGAKREDQMLASSRGVAIKVKEEAPQGKMLVFSAAQGDETAHQLEDKHHGLFTYYLLKELQQTGGDVNMGTLTEYVTKQVKRQSVVINNKKQTPTVIPSQALQAGWQTMRLR